MKGMEIILNERQRQIEAEGFSFQHDDTHQKGELGDAAWCYVKHASSYERGTNFDVLSVPNAWPWSIRDWKPGQPLDDYRKAGALYLAEAERYGRIGPRKKWIADSCQRQAEYCAAQIDRLLESSP